LAQKVSPLLKALTQVTNVNLAIYFNCRDKLSAAPLKSFYRYVLESELRFNDSGLIDSNAFFHNMPQSPLLTIIMHPPEGWMIEVVRSPFDLDNMYLKEVESAGALGEYELEHLIIEGHCYDMISGQPPRGLQFNLGTSSNPNMYDTIVMAKLVSSIFV
jgi:UDP-glucose:glycoprotein glucosyltransferase